MIVLHNESINISLHCQSICIISSYQWSNLRKSDLNIWHWPEVEVQIFYTNGVLIYVTAAGHADAYMASTVNPAQVYISRYP